MLGSIKRVAVKFHFSFSIKVLNYFLSVLLLGIRDSNTVGNIRKLERLERTFFNLAMFILCIHCAKYDYSQIANYLGFK